MTGRRSERSGPAESEGYGFGTFKGVFTPSILTILGVIMYLRLPWVLGSVGLPLTLLIVTLSVSITLLTALSIAAMATNYPTLDSGVVGVGALVALTLLAYTSADLALRSQFLILALLALSLASLFLAGRTSTCIGSLPGSDPAGPPAVREGDGQSLFRRCVADRGYPAKTPMRATTANVP